MNRCSVFLVLFLLIILIYLSSLVCPKKIKLLKSHNVKDREIIVERRGDRVVLTLSDLFPVVKEKDAYGRRALKTLIDAFSELESEGSRNWQIKRTIRDREQYRKRWSTLYNTAVVNQKKSIPIKQWQSNVALQETNSNENLPIILACVIPYSILFIVTLLLICAFLIFACAIDREIKKRRRRELNRKKQIEFKTPKTMDEFNEKYLKELNDQKYLAHLAIAPALNILSFLEAKIHCSCPESLLFLKSKMSLEKMIMKQIFGVFIRNGNREVYMLYPYVDFLSCATLIKSVPHCTRLVDCKGLSVNFWNEKCWNTLSNPKLSIVKALTTTRFDENTLEAFGRSLKNVKHLSLQNYDSRLVPYLDNITSLSIMNTLHENEVSELQKCKYLEAIQVGFASKVTIISLMNSIPSLRKLLIGNTDNIIIGETDWNLSNCSLAAFTLYCSEIATVYVPLFHPTLREVNLGCSVFLDEKSITLGMGKSSPDELIQDAEIPKEPSNIHSLSIVEDMPVSFFNPNVLRRFSNLRRLNVSLSYTTVSLLDHLSELKELRVLHIRVSEKSLQNQVKHSLENLLPHLPYLETILLFDSIMYYKVYINQGGYLWKRMHEKKDKE
jgi:Na+-transporting methylmalonyl-CoA/oxaloacetate decarboxylase gamma subunit